MEIKKVGVLGCGLMGGGIAQTAAAAGFETTVREVSQGFIEQGFASIEKSLERFAEKGTIIASNTSSLSITQMMSVTSPERQQRFIGLHFFNPVPIMKLVEVVRTILTDAGVYDEAVAFAQKLGKVPVRAGDKTGFIVNRLLVPYLLDSIRAL